MKITMLQRGLETSEVLPHHHSNYLGRRHVMKDSSSFRIGLAGDFVKSHGHADWLIYLVDGCLNQTGSTGHEIKMLSDLSCDITAAQKSPSPHGDCIAQKLATLDLAVVWREEATINTGTLQTKPSQRLVNVMSAGVPFVADGTFAAHSDVLHEHLESPFLASSPEQLCTSIHTLIENKHLRKSASKLGLRLARHYTPHAIAQSYANSLTAIAGHPADNESQSNNSRSQPEAEISPTLPSAQEQAATKGAVQEDEATNEAVQEEESTDMAVQEDIVIPQEVQEENANKGAVQEEEAT